MYICTIGHCIIPDLGQAQYITVYSISQKNQVYSGPIQYRSEK